MPYGHPVNVAVADPVGIQPTTFGSKARFSVFWLPGSMAKKPLLTREYSLSPSYFRGWVLTSVAAQMRPNSSRALCGLIDLDWSWPGQRELRYGGS
jgi:hypothetical protein